MGGAFRLEFFKIKNVMEISLTVVRGGGYLNADRSLDNPLTNVLSLGPYLMSKPPSDTTLAEPPRNFLCGVGPTQVH